MTHAIRVQGLHIRETVTVDHDRLSGLVDHLGHARAQDVLRRAMGELSERLALIGAAYRAGDRAELLQRVRGLGGIAEQIGMGTLSRVARDVMATAEADDNVALGATVARLGRLGEMSMDAVCELNLMRG